MTTKTAAASTPKGKPRLPKAGAGKKPEGTQALAEASIVPAMSVAAPRIVDGAMSVHRATASMPNARTDGSEGRRADYRPGEL